MTNINRDPLLRAIYDAAQTIEACGASEALTAAVMAVTAIHQHAERVLDERDAAIGREEALREALDALLEVAEQSVDTRQCSLGILRAMNQARAAIDAARAEDQSK